jgi:methenyltetrahydrofolate cyclohydrolase
MEQQTLLGQSVDHFLAELASGAPTPGGGSVAALSGAMAAGLIAMVCNLSIGKKAYVSFEPEARAILSQAEDLRAQLQLLVQADADVFNRLMAAYRLPRETDADAAARKAAIQHVTREAIEIPIRTARTIAALLPLLAPLARNGNRLAISDAGAAALLIQASVPMALLNVETNLPVIEDQQFVRETRARVADLMVGLQEEITGVLMMVRERLRG